MTATLRTHPAIRPLTCHLGHRDHEVWCSRCGHGVTQPVLLRIKDVGWSRCPCCNEVIKMEEADEFVAGAEELPLCGVCGTAIQMGDALHATREVAGHALCVKERAFIERLVTELVGGANGEHRMSGTPEATGGLVIGGTTNSLGERIRAWMEDVGLALEDVGMLTRVRWETINGEVLGQTSLLTRQERVLLEAITRLDREECEALLSAGERFIGLDAWIGAYCGLCHAPVEEVLVEHSPMYLVAHEACWKQASDARRAVLVQETKRWLVPKGGEDG